MNKTVERLLRGEADCHMLPFFWQHGEDEETLRKYMAVIQEANCNAVCVESRPHPDFCGPKWWKDMDIILDEARRRGMKVWILDDSHFPTGYANGALKDKPDRLRKQSIFMSSLPLSGEISTMPLDLRAAGLLEMSQDGFAPYEKVFTDDRLLFVMARSSSGEMTDLTDRVVGDQLYWEGPAEGHTLLVGVCSRNAGSRRDHINVTQEESVRVLIDAVYEPHWEHYAADFGKTIAGFFSDEPELGNGVTYAMNNPLGTDQDLPWGEGVEKELRNAWGEKWYTFLPYLWTDGEEAPRIRSSYMDILTKKVRRAFSLQLGDWCREHGVRYIGHIIEDEGEHCRTGCSMGHYFRGLQGQDMAGIDNIGGQVLPQGEDDSTPYFLGGGPRKGQFCHYGLAKLAQSAAAIEPRKNGDAMCEIFGNYGWREGVRLEKYMADHFLVRGINQFVPHAFSPKKFPDPDCPPHFYAHGHNPQYRHFGKICGYMDRVATLTSSGKHVVPVAVLYNGELEWADAGAMSFDVALRPLYDRQIDCHVIPTDVFTETDYYRTVMDDPLTVNGQRYHALVVPEAAYLPAEASRGLCKLAEKGLPIFFVNRHPERIAETGALLPDILTSLPAVPLDRLAEEVLKTGSAVPSVCPANDRIRILHIGGDTPVFFLVNEGAEPYEGRITFPEEGPCYLYDPWYNVCRKADVVSASTVALTIEPLKSIAVVFGSCDAAFVEPVRCLGRPTVLDRWTRSLCEGTQYPVFGERAEATLPDDISAEYPEFSGFVRYETSVIFSGEGTVTLEITDADEGVEVFVNGRSLGIEIAPPMRYDLSSHLIQGENLVAIEVATTLERQAFPLLDDYGKKVTRPPSGKSGLTGTVRLYR